MISIRNKSTYDGPGCYVGRLREHGGPSPLANKFKITNEDQRGEALEKYRRWLWQEIKTPESKARKELVRLMAEYNETGNLVLICHCIPKQCHATIIAGALLWMARRSDIIDIGE